MFSEIVGKDGVGALPGREGPAGQTEEQKGFRLEKTQSHSYLGKMSCEMEVGVSSGGIRPGTDLRNSPPAR